jgi:hypothetical protein
MPEGWTPIRQTDFSGGINIVDDPADLTEQEISDSRNVRLTTRKTIEQRLGYTQFNSSAIGAVEVKALHHFLDYSGAFVPIAQAGNNLYKGSAAWTGTGSWSSIHTGDCTHNPSLLVLNDREL